MPTVTLTVDLSDEIADKITALPSELRAQFATAALHNALVALPYPQVTNVPPAMTWEALVAAGSGPEAAAKQKALFAEWVTQAAQIPDDEPDVEVFMASMNSNRLLCGEEPIY